MANRQIINQQEISLSGDFDTEEIDLTQFPIVTVQVTWSGLDSVDAVAVPQGSNDGEEFIVLDDTVGELTFDSTSGSSGWEWPFSYGWRYLRIAVTANSVTTGTLTFTTHAKRND